MKLKVYNRKSTPSGGRNINPGIYYTKNGYITINLACCQILKVQKGGYITFLQDEEKPKDWYILVNTDGFELRQKFNSSSLMIQTAALVKILNTSIRGNDDVVKTFIPIAKEPTKTDDGHMVWALLTAKI